MNDQNIQISDEAALIGNHFLPIPLKISFHIKWIVMV